MSEKKDSKVVILEEEKIIAPIVLIDIKTSRQRVYERGR